MKLAPAFGLLLIVLVAAIGIRRVSTEAAGAKRTSMPAFPVKVEPGSLAPAVVLVPNKPAKEDWPHSMPENRTISDFRALATCAKYRRINKFMEGLAKDPFSWVNNEQARADIGPRSHAHIQEQLGFLETHSDQCKPELTSGESQEDMYQAGLAAARAGDREAAICYVLANCPNYVEPVSGAIAIGHGGTSSPAIREQYLANVHDLIELGREAGDWNMVAVGLGTHGSMGHGLAAEAMPHDLVNAYGYRWLQKLGARGDLAKEADRGVELLESRISPQDIARQQRWATGVYAKHFSERPYVTSGGAVCPW